MSHSSSHLKGPYQNYYPGRLSFTFCVFEAMDIPLLVYRMQLWCGDRFGFTKADVRTCLRVLGEEVLQKIAYNLGTIYDLKSNMLTLNETINGHTFPGWSWLQFESE